MKLPDEVRNSTAILFFDGHCNLCNSSVDYIINKDHKKKFMYSSLQGELANKLIPDHTDDLETFVYFRTKDQRLFKKSSAALKVFGDLGGLYLFLLIGWALPKFIRDFIYTFVAKRRYKWFGKNDSCRVASPEERLLFLD